MAVDIINPMGKRIRKARLALGLNQSQLALQLKIKPQSVQNWEKGIALPKTSRIEDVATALHVDSSWLLHGNTKKESYVSSQHFNHDETLLIHSYRRMSNARKIVFIDIADALANKKD